jgi:hypothetical protein
MARQRHVMPVCSVHFYPVRLPLLVFAITTHLIPRCPDSRACACFLRRLDHREIVVGHHGQMLDVRLSFWALENGDVRSLNQKGDSTTCDPVEFAVCVRRRAALDIALEQMRSRRSCARTILNCSFADPNRRTQASAGNANGESSRCSRRIAVE